MKRWWRRGLLLLLLLLCVAALLGWRWFALERVHPADAAQRQAEAARLRDPALIARGKYLASAGDCAACHTARGGPRYAGGRVLTTPFGELSAPNITPDAETGIGRWSFEDFWRALHLGRGRRGELLYPVFSYTAFTKITRDDALAIFAYLESLPPVRQPNRAPALAFPYSVRSSLLAWRALYFRPGVYRPDPARSAEWNRGAYLVQGLGHCGECHTPRNAWGALDEQRRFAGGSLPAQDWYAPGLGTQAGGGLAGWSRQDIVDLLKTGTSSKGVAFGPMADVVRDSTQYLSDADLLAMATYLQTLPARGAAPAPAALAQTAGHARGSEIYAQQCAACHGKRGEGVAGIYPPLDGNGSVTEPSAADAVRSVLLGGFAPTTAGDPRPYSMPPFAQRLSDDEVAAVVNYIRQSWSNRAGAVWPVEVGRLRHTPVD